MHPKSSRNITKTVRKKQQHLDIVEGGPPRVPEESPRDPERSRDEPKGVSKGGHGWSKRGIVRPKGGPKGPMDAQGGPKGAQRGAEKEPSGPKGCHGSPRRWPGGAKGAQRNGIKNYTVWQRSQSAVFKEVEHGPNARVSEGRSKGGPRLAGCFRRPGVCEAFAKVLACFLFPSLFTSRGGVCAQRIGIKKKTVWPGSEGAVFKEVEHGLNARVFERRSTRGP